MIGKLFFNFSHPTLREHSPTLWLSVAAFLTLGYFVFGLILIGVPGLSVGGIIFATMSFAWLLFGAVTKQAIFPKILVFPILFYIYMALSGFQLVAYPSEYILQMTTIWFAAIAISAFVANGISSNLIVAAMFLVVVANIIAIGIGYDGRIVNTEGANLNDLQGVQIDRFSGLAGQQNLLISIVFTSLFLFFTRRARVPLIVYLVLVAIGIVFTGLTGSRSGIAFIPIFAFFGALFLVQKGILRLIFILATLFVAVPIALFISDDQALDKLENSEYGDLIIVKRTIARIDGNDFSGETRDELRQGYWKYIEQKPLVGRGPDMFSEVSGFGGYAHNNFVELIVNFGVLGSLVYYSMYVVLLIGIVNNAGRNLAFIAPLVFLVAADNWFVTYVSREMILCLCVLLVLSFANHSAHGKRRRRRRKRF